MIIFKFIYLNKDLKINSNAGSYIQQQLHRRTHQRVGSTNIKRAKIAMNYCTTITFNGIWRVCTCICILHLMSESARKRGDYLLYYFHEFYFRIKLLMCSFNFSFYCRSSHSGFGFVGRKLVRPTKEKEKSPSIWLLVSSIQMYRLPRHKSPNP